jgi:PAS domain-containing protein
MAAFHPEDVAAMVERRRASLATGEPFEHEARVRRANGEYRWMFHRSVPLRESEGRVYGPSGAATKLGMARSTLESKISPDYS